MKRIVCLSLLLVGLAVPLCSQTTPKIRELEKRQTELRRQISESETLLRSTKKDVKSQLSNLALLSGQIDERKKYLSSVRNDVQTVQREIQTVEKELHRLQKELAATRQRYDQSVNYMYRNRSVQEKLLFIFSADNLSQMYRRLRYVRQYADYQRNQGERVERKQQQVRDKRSQLVEARKAKERLMDEVQQAAVKLEEQEKEKKELLTSLQKKQKGIQSELNRQRKDADRLNSEIDRLIAIEIEKARKRAEAERRRKAEEARKAAEAAKAAGQKAPETDALAGTATSTKMETYKVDSEDRRLSAVFEQNKGRLPVPVTGPYVIVGHYGQYQVQGLRHVRLDNKGIDIKGKDGAMARCIFDGEVSAIFQYNGLSNVLVRHGSYISVYCNLSHVQVRKGSQLQARDIIGQIHADAEGNAVLHFQLRKETVKLNPEGWIKR